MTRPNDTFVPAPIQVYKDGEFKLPARVSEKDVWLTQRQIADLLSLTVQTVGHHIANYKEITPPENSVIRKFLITATDGKTYEVEHYGIDVLMFVVYRAQNNKKGLSDEAKKRIWAFRQWASGILTRYITGGLRESERYDYENVRTLMTLASDYDPHSEIAQHHFASIQNKLLYAASRHTAADLKATRADHNAPNMGLQTYQGKNITLAAANVGKNYLLPDELRRLNGLVTILNIAAEDFIERGIHTMGEWEKFIDGQIIHMKRELLMGRGQHTAEQADVIVRREYNAYKKMLGV